MCCLEVPQTSAPKSAHQNERKNGCTKKELQNEHALETSLPLTEYPLDLRPCRKSLENVFQGLRPGDLKKSPKSLGDSLGSPRRVESVFGRAILGSTILPSSYCRMARISPLCQRARHGRMSDTKACPIRGQPGCARHSC